jgi:class I fructose-bisphosphate aldolase
MIYLRSEKSTRQIQETTEAFQLAHEFGIYTILWCYLRNEAFKADKDYCTSTNLTKQVNHLGVTIEADIITQKVPTNNRGFKTLQFGKTHN